MERGVEKENNEISLKDVYQSLVKNRKLYVAVSSSTLFLLLVIFLFFLTPVYEVNASLEIRQQNTSPLSINPMAAMLMSSVSPNDKTIDYELLRSRRVLDKVIEKSGLQMKVSKKRNTMFDYFTGLMFKSLPADSFVYFKEIPEALKVDSGIIEADEKSYSIHFNKQEAVCKWDDECRIAGGVVNIAKVGTFSDTVTYEFEYEHIIDARDRVRGWINIGKADESELILLGFVHESPLMGSSILKDLVNVYIDIKYDWEKDDIISKKSYINTTLEELTVGLDEKSRKMILFQQTENTIMPELEIPELLKKQEVLKIQIEELKFKRKIIAGAIDNMEKMSNSPISVPFVFEDLSTQEALKLHNTLLFKRGELSQRVTAEHPLLSAIEKEIEDSSSSLKKMLENTVEQYDRGIKILQELLFMISSGKDKIPENLFTYARLKRDVQLAEQVFVTLSAKLYESAIEPNVGIAPVRLVDVPDPNVKRHFPKARVFAILIMIITIFSGVFAIFLKEFLKATVNSLK